MSFFSKKLLLAFLLLIFSNIAMAAYKCSSGETGGNINGIYFGRVLSLGIGFDDSESYISFTLDMSDPELQGKGYKEPSGTKFFSTMSAADQSLGKSLQAQLTTAYLTHDKVAIRCSTAASGEWVSGIWVGPDAWTGTPPK